MRIFLLLLAIGLLFSAGFYFIHNKKSLKPTVPVTSVFGEKSRIEIVNNWFPEKVAGWENKNSADLYVSAKSALVVDYESGEVIFAKNADERLPAASTVKIMTALVALENASLDDSFTVSENAASIVENVMGLTAGESLTLEELLYGAMLVSGNDAAIAIAEGVAGSEDSFAQIMNEMARRLGLVDTRFINATGLDEDGVQQYSSAHDLATIARYTWENHPEFRKIASTYEKYIAATNNHKEYLLYNDTNLLTSYPGVKGIKPGFTWDALWCLVTYAENDGKKLLAVILGSEDRRGEMALLLDYAFGKYGITLDHPELDL